MYEYGKRIGFSECGTDRKLTLTGLIDTFQDCSTFQSEDVGAGFDVLEKLDLVWVINYWEIEIITSPKLFDRVIVGTFPYSFKSCFGLRNFYLKDENGDYLVKANSMWTLINRTRAHPEKAPDFVQQAYTIEPKLDMTYSSRKVLLPQGDATELEKRDPIVIQPHHLDSNNHVNNGQYVKLAMSQIGDPGNIRSLRIDYRRQAKLGDTIVPVVYSGQNERVVALYDTGNEPFSVSQFIFE